MRIDEEGREQATVMETVGCSNGCSISGGPMQARKARGQGIGERKNKPPAAHGCRGWDACLERETGFESLNGKRIYIRTLLISVNYKNLPESSVCLKSVRVQQNSGKFIENRDTRYSATEFKYFNLLHQNGKNQCL